MQWKPPRWGRGKGEKLEKILYIISVINFAITFIPQIPENIKIGMYIVSIILAGYEILFEGIKIYLN